MPDSTTAPYGAWRSPITAGLIAAGSVGLGQVMIDGHHIYWLESRPAEGGRMVVVQSDAAGTLRDITPAGYNVRTRVHEYGGGAYLVHDGTIFFSNWTDQRIYRQEPGVAPTPITPAGKMRYADYELDERGKRLICVREDHRVEGQEAVNSIVAVGLDAGDEGEILVEGNNFYSTPRLSADGTRLAWLAWNHPNMPWDGTELWTAELAPDGTLAGAQILAGGAEESIFQPTWSPDGTLHFVSDRSGWWNLYRWHAGSAQAIYPLEAEFGVPQWVFGMSTYAFISAELLVCTYTSGYAWRMATLNTRSGAFQPLDHLPYTDYDYVVGGPAGVACLAGSPAMATAVVRVDPKSGETQVLRRSIEVEIDPGYVSVPQPIEFPTSGDRTAFALYYPPTNRDFRAPPGELPPLRVLSHGGPTGAVYPVLSLGILYWTSRGFAVLNVNYGGSSGYGRAYRARLDGQWGVVDVDDCTSAALHLVKLGLVDGNRLAIAGGSAGGYTTLSALTFRQVFRAGASHFGVSDLEALATDTHKFESRYLDRIVGPYPAQKDLYEARSPIYFTEQLGCPIILFQGLEDRVVPPGQAEKMFSAVRAKGLPVAYLPFEGEQHGFRKAENIKRTLEAELYFYGKIFGFTPADKIEPVQIENLS